MERIICGIPCSNGPAGGIPETRLDASAIGIINKLGYIRSLRFTDRSNSRPLKSSENLFSMVFFFKRLTPTAGP